MTPIKLLANNRGITLVELMISVLILAFVFAGIYNVQQSMQRSAGMQEEYVDMEQNLRIGMDSIAKDIRIAGYLVPAGNTSFSVATATSFTLRTFSAPGLSARVMTDVTTTGTTTTNQVVATEDPQPFVVGNYVRIIRPRDLKLPIERVLTVAATTTSSVTLNDFNEVVDLLVGDMLTLYSDPDTDADNDPNTFSGGDLVTDSSLISYALVGDELTRTAGTAAVVAEDLNSIAFLYFLDDGTNTVAPIASQLDNIIGIEVTLNAQATTAEGTKNRSLVSSILMRNL